LRLAESKVAKKKNLKIKSQKKKIKRRKRKMIKKIRSRMMVWENLRNSSLAKKVSKDPRLSLSLPNS
jgi:hypothetical protein